MLHIVKVTQHRVNEITVTSEYRRKLCYRINVFIDSVDQPIFYNRYKTYLETFGDTFCNEENPRQ